MARYESKYDELLLLLEGLRRAQKELENLGYDPCGDAERRIRLTCEGREMRLDSLFKELVLSVIGKKNG